MSSELTERCVELQNDEIEVLESIYPGQTTLSDDVGGKLLSMSIPIALGGNTQVKLVPSLSRGSRNGESSTSGQPIAHPELVLSHLPPLTMQLLLAKTYPLEAPARVVALKAGLEGDERSSWLPRAALQAVQNKLGVMWTEEKEAMSEGSGVLWKWWDWIGTGEFLAELGMMDSELSRLSVPPALPLSIFHTLLKTYNAAQLNSSFEQTAFSCTICFENRKGKSCVQMPCGCVFCNPCLNACWTLAISEGTLESVACPSPGCVKKRATRDAGQAADAEQDLDPALVESVVGEELRLRWEELRDRRKAEIGTSPILALLIPDPTYCVCPQPNCQAAVPPPPTPSAADLSAQETISKRAFRITTAPSSSPSQHQPSTIPREDRWARYRQCPKCTFSFCLYCSATWHGPHTPCSFPQTSLIVLEYLSYPEGSAERAQMEQRRGKSNLERMVARYVEDEENKKWLEQRTRACAGCGVRVEKSHGCNHMTCGRCGSHFCYRCGTSLRSTDPYMHYRTPGSCFEKLFDQEEIARFERETAMQQAGIVDFDGGDAWGARNVWEW
ncbi:uncharacterized protein MKK02DRAFT_27103 [Dioszegia hungarica]|uniref:RBR-type E3 ubiquitin transferase n=1 Tax=Dioszegia hungarica TaxID=4972 RepID=A0AA38LVG7_9TREE|nr:uncharacterized protein MKK02DRAFT_27103 [Dioszegia hungarica]KAI9635251.1 hypothetical protein MKK02DRAFT_27103 [Dioszegia hungarica]